MDEIKAFRTFLLAAEKRSFAQVARDLDTTPAFVSRTIATLEEELGVQLFVRTTRRVSLTTEGALFAARIDPAMRMLGDAHTDMINAHKADEGRLRLNAPMSLGQRVLPEIVGNFRNLYPKIAVELSLTDRLIDVVEQNFDLAIRISGPPSDKFTIWRKICEVRRILVAAPDTACSAATHPNDLNPDACLAYSPDSRLETWELSDGKTMVTVSAGRSVSANNGELLARMAADGAGVALLPVFIVAEHLKAGRLIPVLTGWHPPQLWLTLYYPPYQKLPPRIDAFSNFVEQHIPTLMTTLE